MRTSWLSALVPMLLIGTAGCPDVKVDPGEGVNDEPTSGPIAEFDPSNRIIPFPNNLLLDPMTGKVNVPASCNESAASMATRVGVLNQLDGFGTFETAITVTFTAPVDAASLTDRVLLYKRAGGGTAVDPATATPVPVVTLPSMTARFAADCMGSPTMVDQLVIVPRIPLDQKSVYVVALTDGITAGGEPVGPSFTWAIVRQEANPVVIDESGTVTTNNTPLDPRDAADLAQLQGINLLWNAHAQAMAFIRGTGVATEDVILAWEFKTQTITDALDPTVAGSPAAEAATTPALAGVQRINAQAPGEAFLRAALPAGSCSADGGPLPCQAVGEALTGGLVAKQFQVGTPNPLSGGTMIPGPWADPIRPPTTGNTVINPVITTPAAACPAAGCPTVIFGHGLGRSRTDMFAIASQFAGVGMNVVAIDAVAHGSRAVRISDQGPCAGTPSPATAPQCFAPFLSANLAATRDNIRQSVVDLHSLTAALKACGTTNCGALQVDPAKILYIGQSLGGIMGGLYVATNPDVNPAVLNVPGVGWVDILENTQTNAIKCSLVDALIDAGILMGDKSSAGATALCLGDAWKTQAGYRQFSAIGRWVLDPADPANFTRLLAQKRILIQEVVGDTVVPNVATRNEGMLVGLQPMAASCPAVPPATTPSTAITTNPMANKWLQYTTADAATCAPAGATYAHGSLLSPAAATTAGSLATARMQTDAITFLVINQ